MPYEAALAIAIIILVGTFVGMVALISRRRRQAKEDDMAREAASRGWQFDSRFEHGERIRRWRGTTDGISWVTESVSSAKSGNHPDRRRQTSRWHGAFNPGIGKPIVMIGVPPGKETPAFSVAEGDGVIAKLAQKAAGFAFDKGIKTYFGADTAAEVSADALHHVAQPVMPGYIVMAGDADEAARVLSEGFGRVVQAGGADSTSLLGADDRPWILLRPNGVSIARMEPIREAHDIERLVRAGVDLSGGFTFGRR